MVTCYVGVGSNLGDRRSYIEKAIDALRNDPDIADLAMSSIYETEPVSNIPQGMYLNGVVMFSTDLTPQRLLERLNQIEAGLGRTRERRNAPRTIDLDILYYGSEAIETEQLTIPHPRIAEREFVLRGLRELGKLS